MHAVFISGLVLALAADPRLNAQVPVRADTASRIRSADSSGIIKPVKADIVNTLTVDFFTTLNGVRYEHAMEKEQKAQLYFYYNATGNNLAKTKYFTIRTYLFNEYGLHHYFDSVTIKSEDNIRLRNNIEVPAYKFFAFAAGLDVKTQLWKTYSYRPDTGDQYRRYLHSDYFSPGYTVYSFGGSARFWDDASVDVGLIGGKITRIRNRHIFKERAASRLYGLSEDERRKVEWGISVQLSIPPRMLGKHLGWELSGTAFAPRTAIGRIRSYTADANNAAHYIFFRHMRVSLRTQLLYDESVQPGIFVMNHVSLGFYMNNKL